MFLALFNKSLLLIALLFTLQGCAPMVRLGPGASAPALLANNTTYPATATNSGPVIPYSPEEVEILHWVQSEEASRGVNARFPIFGSRDLVGIESSDYAGTYQELLKEHNLDGLLNITVDTRRSVLNLILIRGTKWRTLVGGVGYRIKDKQTVDSPQ
ncbi:MAG: hypothetical protein ACFCU1_05630 [Sumerlaeia bacterium]